MLQTFAIYLLKMIICSGLLFGYYWISLRNNRFHYYNRFYLLMSVALSIVLPILSLQLLIFNSNSDNAIHLLSVIYTIGENNVVVKGAPAFDWQQLLTIGLIAVPVYLLFSLCVRILKIYKFKKIYPVNKTEEFDFINTDLSQAPFSFLKNIFWRNDISIEEATGQQILQHELTHIKQKHTWDKLFIQIVLCFFWMNPFFWIMRSELYFIHEFIADEKAVSNKDASAFAAMLLQAQYGKSIFTPAQSFFYSPIKRRLFMLTTSKEPRFSYARRIMALPLLAFIILLSAFKLQKETITKTNAETQSVKSTKNKGEAAIKKDDDKEKNGVTEITKKEKAEQQTENIALDDTIPQYEKILDQVQQEPKFPGGPEAWARYLEKTVNLDVLSNKKAPPGNYTVVVTFLVDNEGNVSEVKALNDPGYGAADEAVRVIANSGKWVPATQNDKPVTYSQKQSITFRIDESPKTKSLKNDTHSASDIHNTQLQTDNFKFTPPTIVKDTNFVEASFPGGHDEWQRFLERNINANIPVDKGAPPGSYKVIVSFLVDANGKVSKVKAVNDPGYGTAKEAVRLIANGPDWIPAKNNNSPVSSMVKQDITFQVSEQ